MSVTFRNPRYSGKDDGSINVEIEHLSYGWIPFTASPNDVEELGRSVYEEVVRSGTPIAAAEPSADADLPALTAQQFEWLLASTGLDDAWDATQARAKARGKRSLYARLKAQRLASSQSFATLLALREHLEVAPKPKAAAAGIDLTDDALRAAWRAAAQQTPELSTDA